MPRPARSHRREVLALLAGFIAIQLAVAVVIETRRPGVRDPHFGRKLELLRAKAGANPGQPLCLALGSSRVMNGLRPADLPSPCGPGGEPVSVFNFALPLCGPLQESLTLERILADGHRPRWLVLEVTPALLGQAENPAELLTPERISLRELALAHPNRAAYTDWARSRLIPAFTYRHTLLSRSLPTWVPWGSRYDYIFDRTDADGWTQMTAPNPSLREWVRTEERRRFENFSRCGVGDSARQGFATLTRLAREHDIRVLIVIMPEGRELQAVYPPGQWELYMAFVGEVARELRAEVVNARDWMPEESFADGHHLLPEAATAFSRRFGAEAMTRFLSGSR